MKCDSDLLVTILYLIQRNDKNKTVKNIHISHGGHNRAIMIALKTIAAIRDQTLGS